MRMKSIGAVGISGGDCGGDGGGKYAGVGQVGYKNMYNKGGRNACVGPTSPQHTS